MTGGPLPEQGHQHELTVPIDIGPTALRIVVLAAVPAVAAFVLLRPFVPDPGRRTIAVVTVTSALSVILMLMLAGGVDIPSQAVVPVLAALACPLVAAVGTNVGRLRSLVARAGPWVLLTTTVLGTAKVVRGWLADDAANQLAVVLYTGAILALVGLSWSAVCQPRGRPMKSLVHGAAAVSALAALGGATWATLLRLPG